MKNWKYIEGAKTGNDTPFEYAHRKPKVINDDKTGAEEFFKKLSDDVKEREEKDDADIEKVGNSLIGKTVWVKKSDGHQYKATVLREDGGRVYVNTGDGDQFWRLKHEVEVINKVGNEASDDKFAYVMREFDEGKLKTPDGKVVTDPAQAKAIAYSESKKTENGLTRARNAMACNKKVKNSAVREYEHPDGRVAQIDFNDDGTDADMSIYEGTKEIEQKNFSTIRDAEQYVTSHGFRRI